jgi:hypothetical protein
MNFKSRKIQKNIQNQKTEKTKPEKNTKQLNKNRQKQVITGQNNGGRHKYTIILGA